MDEVFADSVLAVGINKNQPLTAIGSTESQPQILNRTFTYFLATEPVSIVLLPTPYSISRIINIVITLSASTKTKNPSLEIHKRTAL